MLLDERGKNGMLKDTEKQELDQQKILINDLLMDCITIMRMNEDHEVIFNKLLDLVASFYEADRSYVFEFDLGSQRMSNTYEWCAEGLEAEIENASPFMSVVLSVLSGLMGPVITALCNNNPVSDFRFYYCFRMFL